MRACERLWGTHTGRTGPLIVVLGAGQAMVAFATTMSSWVSLHDLHCNSDSLYVNICRAQGFFLVAGSHLLITSYACYMHMPPNGRISAGFSSLRLPRGAYGATTPPPRFDSAVATGTDPMILRWLVWVLSAHRWILALFYIIPAGCIIYCCAYLGTISAVRGAPNEDDSHLPYIVYPLHHQSS